MANKFIAYICGVCPYSGKTQRSTVRCNDLTTLVGSIVCRFESGAEIILNGHDLTLDEIRRWALISEECKL